MATLQLVTGYDDVSTNIRRFNDDLERAIASDASVAGADVVAATRLAERLSFNRAWYYADDLDLVGPSKFVGYAGMTAALYTADEDLDGRHTEPTLQQWFRVLQAGTPEEAYVRAKVEALLARHGKAPSRKARFCARPGWRAPGAEPRPRGAASSASTGRRTIHATIIRGEAMFVAECDPLGVVTQGRIVDEALANLKEAIELHLEGEDLAALGLAPEPVVLVTMELLPWAA